MLAAAHAGLAGVGNGVIFFASPAPSRGYKLWEVDAGVTDATTLKNATYQQVTPNLLGTAYGTSQRAVHGGMKIQYAGTSLNNSGYAYVYNGPVPNEADTYATWISRLKDSPFTTVFSMHDIEKGVYTPFRPKDHHITRLWCPTDTASLHPPFTDDVSIVPAQFDVACSWNMVCVVMTGMVVGQAVEVNVVVDMEIDPTQGHAAALSTPPTQAPVYYSPFRAIANAASGTAHIAESIASGVVHTAAAVSAVRSVTAARPVPMLVD